MALSEKMSDLMNDEDLDFILNEIGNIDTISPSTSRFVAVTEEELKNDLDNRIPSNTRNKMAWAMRIFRSWHNEWKTRIDTQLKVFKEVNEFNKGDLNQCLIYFFAEVRKTNGQMYPPETLKSLATMIQLYFRIEMNWTFSFFIDNEFKSSRESLDAQMKKSASVGNQKPKKRAAPIDFEQEDALWSNGSFGISNGRQLIHTLIFHLGIHCSLRAAKEHHDLNLGENEQIKLKRDKDGQEFLEYTEHMSKNKRFGINCTRMDPKVTCVYSNTQNPSRCIVNMYKTYMQHRPKNGKCQAFYLTPLPENQIKNDVWYKDAPMGIHSIETTTKTIMKSITNGDESFYSNTSLRRTAKTRLVMAGISNEVASIKTGRISESADRVYVHRQQFEKQMSTALYNTKAATTSSDKSFITISHSESEHVQIPNELSASGPASKFVFSNCTFSNCTF